MTKEEKIAYESALNRLRFLEQENAILKNRNTKINNDFLDVQANLNGVNAQILEMVKAAKESSKSVSKLEKENQKLSAKIESMKEQISEKDKENGRLNKELVRVNEEIDKIKKQLIEAKIMEAKAVSALFAKASAKTKNLAKSIIRNNPNPSIKKEGEKQAEKRGRKEGTENFGNWNPANFLSVEKKAEIVQSKLFCNSCGGNLVFQRSVKIQKISLVKEHLRKTEYEIAMYKCANCGEIVQAKIDDPDCYGNAACTPELGGYLALLSCGLYLPANRISELFEYNETPISRELVTRYLIRTGELLAGFAETIRKRMHQSHVLMLDETVWYALNDKNETNRIWTMTTGPRESFKAMYYMYSTGREKKNLDAMLDPEYAGTIVTDNYAVYLARILHQLCWSHLRKYLYDELNALGKEAPDSQDCKDCKLLLDKVNLIFDKERELAKITDLEELKRRRISELKPLIDDYFRTAESLLNPDVRDSKYKAINYGVKDKELYYTLIENPYVPLTNNASETSARKAVLKRNSSMFSTSVDGAKSMCVLLTIVQSARVNGLSPDKYVTHLLRHLDDLSDERVAVGYLPWSKTMKETMSFTPEEIAKATKEAEEEIAAQEPEKAEA